MAAYAICSKMVPISLSALALEVDRSATSIRYSIGPIHFRNGTPPRSAQRISRTNALDACPIARWRCLSSSASRARAAARAALRSRARSTSDSPNRASDCLERANASIMRRTDSANAVKKRPTAAASRASGRAWRSRSR